MPKLSKYVLQFVYLTIPGFVYLTSAFLLLQAWTDDYVNLYVIREFWNNSILIIGIFTLVFSYTIGLIVYFAEQRILHWFCPKLKSEKKKLIGKSKRTQKDIASFYQVLIMIRHLICSLLLFGLALLYWFIKHNQSNLISRFLLVFIVSFIVLFLAYHKIREVYKETLNRSEKKKTKSKLL